MKFIVLGDLHFGIKGFSNEFLDHQLRFFHTQLFPYMKEHGITTIVQLGDFLDNRKVIDIQLFDRLNKDFFEPIKEHGFDFITFLGNHDIYYRTKLDTNIVKYFGELYPNVKVIQEKEMGEEF